jgi:hypothetical protein
MFRSGDWRGMEDAKNMSNATAERSSRAKKLSWDIWLSQTNADEDGTRTRATFVTRKLIAKQC